MSLKVLVVDDTIVYRKILSEALAAIPGVDVVGSAANGKIALTRIKTLKPDILTLDLEMPEMGGLELLEIIQRDSIDVGAILVSSLTVQGGDLTIKGLELGAFDFVTKPEGGSLDQNRNVLQDALTPLLNCYSRLKKLNKTSLLQQPAPSPRILLHPLPADKQEPCGSRQRPEAVAIGVSTGGPNALTAMMRHLPGNLGVPVFIVQHMPPLFTAALANSLNRLCELTVKEAENNEPVKPNIAYIAPGGRQMKVTMAADGVTRQIRITDDPPENNCRPAVDYLFRSIAQQYNGRATGVIMTGMGSDGSTGIRLMKRAGSRIIAQDEASCVVFGMPKAAIATGAVDLIVSLDEIAREIVLTLR